MNLLGRFRLWYSALWHRDAVEAAMAREMAAHIAMEEAHLLANGAVPEEARRQARLTFGALEMHKEAVRDEHGTQLIEQVRQDIRIALRGLRKRPGFTLGVVFTLGLGIGPTIAAYAWANWILLRPIPGIVAPAQLTAIGFGDPRFGSTGMSYPGLDILRQSSPLLRNIAGYSVRTVQIDRGAEPPREISGALVAGDYFGVLGVTPALGRLFAPGELTPASGASLVVISDGLWRSHFGADSSLIGRTVRFNNSPFTVIGVTPRGFAGNVRLKTIDAWFAPAGVPALLHGRPDRVYSFGYTDLSLVVRRDPGVTRAAILASVRQATNQLTARAGPDTYSDTLVSVSGNISLPENLRDYLSHTVHLIMAVVGLVLLCAAANAANLVLLRGRARMAELGVRRALGASRFRLVLFHGIEAVILSGMGTLAGGAIAWFVALAFAGRKGWGIPAYQHLPYDRHVFVFMALLCVTCTLLFTFIPSLIILGRERTDPLRSHPRVTASGGRLTSSLAALQLALSMALVVTSFLLIRTIRHLQHVDLGFDPHGVSSYTVHTVNRGYSAIQMHSLRLHLLDELSARPGVAAVAVSGGSQFMTTGFMEQVQPVGTSQKERGLHFASFSVSPDYFTAIGIPLLMGRTFTPEEFDDSTESAILINRSAAVKLFGNANPIGQEVETPYSGSKHPLTIVGVVGDTRVSSVRGEMDATLYRAIPDPWQMQINVLVRSRLPSATIARALRAAVDQVDPSLPVASDGLLSEAVADSMSREALLSRLLTLLGSFAIVLAALGLYAVVAQGVLERTREIGVRMALGARPAAVVTLVLAGGFRLVGIGIVLGTVGAVMLARTIRAILFGVAPTDPVTYVAAAVVALIVCAAACFIPARAATRVDPVRALRAE